MPRMLEVLLLFIQPMQDAIAALTAQVAAIPAITTAAAKDLKNAIAGAVTAGYLTLTAQLQALNDAVGILGALGSFQVTVGQWHVDAGVVAPVAAGSPFPLFSVQDATSTGFATPDANTLTVSTLGLYRFAWCATIAEAGQMQLMIDKGGGFAAIPKFVAGRSAVNSQIVAELFVRIDTVPSRIQVWNPAGEVAALTVVASPGGAKQAAANFSAMRVAI